VLPINHRSHPQILVCAAGNVGADVLTRFVYAVVGVDAPFLGADVVVGDAVDFGGVLEK